MKPAFIIPCFLLFISNALWGQASNVIPSSNAVANIQTPRTDGWTSFHNPASLIQDNPFQAAVQYENRYLLAALNTASLQAAYCNPYVNVGVGFSFFGYSKYQEMMAGITLAHSFNRFSIGLQTNYLTIYCGDEIKYRGTIFPQVGVTVDITSHLTLGLHSFNPFLQKIRIDDECRKALPSIYSVGADYRFADHLRWAVQADYDIRSTFRIATAFEWEAIEQLVLKLGAYYYTQFVGCMGISVRRKGLILDTNFELNPRLGLTCQIRVGYMLPCVE